MIKLHLDVSDVLHAKKHTKYANCGLRVNFGIFFLIRFYLMMKKLSKSCCFALRSPLTEETFRGRTLCDFAVFGRIWKSLFSQKARN